MFLVLDPNLKVADPIVAGFAKRTLRKRQRANNPIDKSGFKTADAAETFARMMASKYGTAYTVVQVAGTAASAPAIATFTRAAGVAAPVNAEDDDSDEDVSGDDNEEE